MNRNVLYPVIGVLAAVAVIVGYQIYQRQQATTGIQIEVGEDGVSIQSK